MGQSVGEQRVFGCWDLLGAGKVIDRFYGAGPKLSSGDEACCRIWPKWESDLKRRRSEPCWLPRLLMHLG